MKQEAINVGKVLFSSPEQQERMLKVQIIIWEKPWSPGKNDIRNGKYVGK